MKTVSSLNWKNAGNSAYFKGIKTPEPGGFKANSALNNKTQETFQPGKKEDGKTIQILKSALPLCIICAACGCYVKFLKGYTQLGDGLEAISKYHLDKFNKKIFSLSESIRRILPRGIIF